MTTIRPPWYREEPFFTCESCGETYLKSRTDGEARKEAERLFADSLARGEDMAVICDDCFKRLFNV